MNQLEEKVAVVQKGNDGIEPILSTVLQHLPGLIWALIGLALLFYFRRSLQKVVEVLALRIQSGAAVKLGPVEIAELRVSADSKISRGGPISARIEESGKWNDELESIYDVTRNCFIVSKLFPSKSSEHLYDVLLYISAKKAKLGKIEKVEYFFGKKWGSQIFTSVARAKKFGIVVSANGAGIICTAKIHFTDGMIVDAWHFTEFGSGSLGQSARDC